VKVPAATAAKISTATPMSTSADGIDIQRWWASRVAGSRAKGHRVPGRLPLSRLSIYALTDHPAGQGPAAQAGWAERPC
jgi:hypothetical protein